MPRPLSDFKVLSFDCYGTLIDWETGIWDALQPLLMHNATDAVSRRQALNRFGEHEFRCEQERPGAAYPEVLERVHAGLAGEFGLESSPGLDRDFGRSVGQWPAFPDTAEALRALKTRYRLVILSNVDRASFAASNRKLGVAFDAVCTAEDIGSYKPDPRNFDYLVEQVERRFGLGPDTIMHTAQSLFHDHVPARARGLANTWIDRHLQAQGGDRGATAEPERLPEIDYRFHALAEMAAAVE